ncbi:hypothetical protein VNO78_15691 [Psophocarpus tetragonolobus]|uniref:Uncharacterized protein n=1 Tax=Psophocarpus tetragonolobus TaxID=3891 RepID=A0AAN9SKR6_PSOTE
MVPSYIISSTRMQPERPSNFCNQHPEEQFIGFCPLCLCERLVILRQNYPFFINSPRESLSPLSLQQPHHPSNICDRHPEHFTGFCSSCLNERLTIVRNNYYSSFIPKPSTSTTLNPKAIFQPITTIHHPHFPPSSYNFQPKLRRSQSYPTLENKPVFYDLEPPQNSCNIIPKKEPKVEMRNLASSSILVQKDKEIIEEEPNIEIKVDVELENTQKVMEDQMDIDSLAKKSFDCNFKGCIWNWLRQFSRKGFKSGDRSRRQKHK